VGIRIIAELGSCHEGKLTLLKEAVDRCADMGIDALKVQLFPNTKDFTATGDIWLPPDVFLEGKEYAEQVGVPFSASVFGEDEFDFLLRTNPPFIKISYSQKNRADWIRESLDEGLETIVSCDVMTDKLVPAKCTKLFCVPLYPVYFQVRFDNLFPRFDGFSDHTMGFDQTLESVSEGATVIEKHMRLGSTVSCPDAYFSLSPAEMAAMVSGIRYFEKQNRGGH